MGRDQGGASIGTSDITYRGSTTSLSFANVLSLQRGKQNFRVGGEIVHSEWRTRAAVFSYGEIDFPTFEDFLIGNTGASQFPDGTSGFAHLGIGLTRRDFLTTDYHLFIQDDWKVASKFTVNLGLRYELDSPPYDSQGRIGGFDPALYRPRLGVDSNGFPAGPPAGGIIEAGNALPEYSVPGVLRVGKRMIKSIDPNNFGPRVGLAWSPLESGRLAVRAGYGIFFARPSFFTLHWSILILRFSWIPTLQDSHSVSLSQPRRRRPASRYSSPAASLIQGRLIAMLVLHILNNSIRVCSMSF
jgi:outer membrane receptor protein involved in Fe transport